MTTREKILVGLMIAAVCLGTLALMGDLQDAGTTLVGSPAPQPLAQMLARVTAQVDAGASMEHSRYILATAQEPWQAKLFVNEDHMLPAEDGSGGTGGALPANLALVYDGYIETHRRRVAIINGIEYVVGDQLEQTGYTIRHIGPDQVVIEAPQQRMLTVPLVENWEAGTP